MKSKVEFSKFMSIIAEMFEKTLSEALTGVYWKALEPFTDDQCKKAFSEVILSSRFFPKPVDIIEAIHGNRGEVAMLAWEKVYGAICQIGAYQSVQFDDPVIHSTIELMGGWVELCKMKTEDVKWKQVEFEKIYKAMSKKGNHPKRLAGMLEIDNGARGFKDNIPKQILVGEKRLLR